MIKESEGNIRLQFAEVEKKDQINKIIQKCCKNDGINIKELRAGSWRRQVVLVRKRLIQILVGEVGVSLADTARHLGVSTSGVSKSLMREASRKSS